MATCPCCSDQLLRHIRKGSLYWFCRSCYSEMPNFEDYVRAQAPAPVQVSPVLQPRLTPVKHRITNTLRNPSEVAA